MPLQPMQYMLRNSAELVQLSHVQAQPGPLEYEDSCVLVGTSSGHLQLHADDGFLLHRQRLHATSPVVSIAARACGMGEACPLQAVQVFQTGPVPAEQPWGSSSCPAAWSRLLSSGQPVLVKLQKL